MGDTDESESLSTACLESLSVSSALYWGTRAIVLRFIIFISLRNWHMSIDMLGQDKSITP